MQIVVGVRASGTPAWLETSAASSYQAALRDGCPTAITDAGRTLAEQIELFLLHYTTDFATSAQFDRRSWDGRVWWRRPNKPSAATPGSSAARHQKGLSLDLPERGGDPRAWMHAHGATYGWIAWIVKGGAWHFEYQHHRNRVTAATPTAHLATPVVVPAPADPSLEDDMMERALIAAYRVQCGRVPGPTELDPRLLRIALEQSTLAEEIRDIDGSTESNRFAVILLYRELLGRDATVVEADHWIAATGNDIFTIRAGIAASDEAKAHAGGL